MKDDFYSTTLALAGLVQAVHLVRELAHTGKIYEPAYEASIYSVLQTTAPDIASIYGNLSGIKTGLEKIIQVLSARNESTRPIVQHMLGLIHLQKKIARSPKLTHYLSQRLNQVSKQAEYFHLTHPTVIHNLADIYLHVANPFKFKIVVWGTHRSLSVNENMEKIRALLLAGLRSTVLWRQVGGSRWQLFFSREKIKKTAHTILAQIENAELQSQSHFNNVTK